MGEAKKMRRHGDVGIFEGATIPPGAEKLKTKVIAEGEVTGHAHRIGAGAADIYEKDGVMYLRVHSETATITHEEHGPLEIPKGDHQVRIQEEYDFSEGFRKVMD